MRLYLDQMLRADLAEFLRSERHDVARFLLPLLSNRPQTDFRNRLVIVSSGRARWIRTTDE